VDSAGKLYVTDAEMIRKITPVGTNWVVTTIAGLRDVAGWVDGTGSEVRFYSPQGVAADTAGNLYVVDSNNHAIRMGVPSSVMLPVLQMAREEDKLILSWPLSAEAFVLETASAPLTGAVWTPLTNGVSASGDNFVLTNSFGLPKAFYRLRSPH
jgi:DNA-binding beta-propeller fold protein YncE